MADFQYPPPEREGIYFGPQRPEVKVAATSGLPGVIRWGELPVPYVASWSSESGLYVKKDPLIRQPALFRGGQRGQGRPIFGKMDEARVRKVVVRELCQVCCSPLRGEGFVCEKAYGTFDAGRNGSAGSPLVREPLACRACFRVALSLCPGLQRHLEDTRAILARVTSYDVMLVTMAQYDGGQPELNKVLEGWDPGVVVGYASVALTAYEPITLEELA